MTACVFVCGTFLFDVIFVHVFVLCNFQRTSNHAFESRVTPTAFLSKSLEDVAADGQKKTPPALEANKNRLSFKFVRQVKVCVGVVKAFVRDL